MDHGSVFRRCGCRDQRTGRLLGASCPRLRSSRHGSWYFSAELPSPAGERRRVRRGGFATRTAAMAALDALTGPTREAVRGITTGEWLARWQASRVSLRASTSRGYAAHVRAYLVPHTWSPIPGRHPAGGAVARRRAGHVHRHHPRRGRARAPGQRDHAAPHPRHATLNAAVRAGLITANPGPVARTAQGCPPAPAGVDPGADRALAAGRSAACGRGMERRADRAVPAPGARPPAVRAVPPDRAARAAPRRGRRAAVPCQVNVSKS